MVVVVVCEDSCSMGWCDLPPAVRLALGSSMCALQPESELLEGTPPDPPWLPALTLSSD